MTDHIPRKIKRGIPPHLRATILVSARLDKGRLARLREIAALEVPSPSTSGMIERAIARYIESVDAGDRLK
jgi:hypothetical protein